MLIVAILFIVLLILNMPLGFTIGISALVYYLLEPMLSVQVAVQRVATSTQSFAFLAVPFFLIAGNIMNASGITKRLVKLATVLAGHFSGGLAQVSIALSALMGGISGSAVADASMEARFLGPSMKERGYSVGFTAAVLSLGSLITATIPPSLGLIIFGSVGEVSVGKLFLGGVIPGILMTVILMVPTYFISKKRGYKPEREKAPSFKEVIICFKECIWALLFPIILVVGIRFGFFTPSEAGAFAIVYAMVIGKFVYKELSFKSFMEVIDQGITDNGVIMLIVTFAGIFGYISAYDGFPQTMAVFVGGLSSNPQIILFFILAFLLFAGMIMEGTVNVLLFIPIFLPILRDLGIDPVHFGILCMTVVTFGCMTPPVGTAMYSVCNILGCDVAVYTKEAIPYFLAIIFEIILLCLFPQLVLFLPNLIF